MTVSALVSVIICNYNYGRFLKEALKSVLDQTYENIEIIVVDDGSTDNSREVVEEFDDSRIIKIYQENRGQAVAFNSGFQRTTGQYVAFLDSDDYWHPDKIQKTIAIYHSNHDISLVQHPLEVVDKNSRSMGAIHPPTETEGLKDLLREYYLQNHTNFFSTTSGLMIPRVILEKIFPLDESWNICADVLFTRPLPLFGHVYYLNEPLGGYRIHDDNQWMNSDKQKSVYENNLKYVEYTNQWLSKMGKDKVLLYEKSIPHARWLRNKFTMAQPEWYLHTSILTAKKIISSLRS